MYQTTADWAVLSITKVFSNNEMVTGWILNDGDPCAHRQIWVLTQAMSILSNRAKQYPPHDPRLTGVTGGPITIRITKADVTDSVARNTPQSYPDNGSKKAERTDQRVAFLTDPVRECFGNTDYIGASEALPSYVLSIKQNERDKAPRPGGPRTMEQISPSIQQRIGHSYKTDDLDSYEDPFSVIAFLATDVVAEKSISKEHIGRTT